jgi:tyrosine-protein phosphatase YwqE
VSILSDRIYVNEAETVCLVDFQIIGTQQIYAELAILDDCGELIVITLKNKIYILICPKEAIAQGLVYLTKVTFLLQQLTYSPR